MKFRKQSKVQACKGGCPPASKLPTTNALLRFDPTRTSTLRRAWVKELRARFAKVKALVRKRILTLTPTANAAWSALPNPHKVQAFKKWVEGLMQDQLVGKSEDALWKKYIEQGYKKGAGRAFDDKKARDKSLTKPDFYAGSRDQFLKDTFAQPVSVERVKSLVGRNYNELDGISDTMGTRMTRTLADGLVEGKSPYDIADDLDKDLDIGAGRSEMIARTEIIRAHAEGQLDSLERMGVKQVGVEVEWLATDDNITCPECAAMEGEVFEIEEARGKLPLHPNCRCAWIPANVDEEDDTAE